MSIVDNRTQLQDSEADADVSGDTDASPTSSTSEAGFVIEGTNAQQFQITNAQEHILWDQDSAGSTFSLNLADSTVYINVKDNLGETFANLGGQICFNDGADGAGGDDIGYNVNGADVVGLPYAKRYSAIKLDVSVVVATPGTDNVDFYTYNGTEANLDHTAILQVGYGSIHLAKAQGTVPNAWIDGVYYIANDSYALTIQGGTVGTPETPDDVVTDDEAIGAGLFAEIVPGVFGIFGPTEWGTPSGTADSYFTATDQEFILYGDNGGGHAVGATHMPIRVIGNATGTNSAVYTRTTFRGIGTRAQIDWSDANFDIIKFDTCTFIQTGTQTFNATLDATDKFCDNSTFIDCDQIDFGATSADGNVFEGSNDANGAVIWSTTPGDVANQDNFTFNSDGTGHAIYINLNTASLTTYNVDGYSVSGYETTDDGSTGNTVFLVDNAQDGDVTINVSNGTGTFSYERAAGYTGTVTVNISVNCEFEVVDRDDAAIQSVRITAYLVSDDSEVINDVSNASGIASATFTGTTPANMYYRYRKSSTGAQKYVNLSGLATIAAVVGSTVKRNMRQDDIADPTI